MEIESFGSGVLRQIVCPAGGSLPVGQMLGIVADPGEDITAVLARALVPSDPLPGTSAGVEQPRERAEPARSCLRLSRRPKSPQKPYVRLW